ncbi:phage tail protein [Lactovum odontotermitis]
MADNKVTFGLKNVHLWEMTDDGTAVSYGDVIPWKGATEISLDPAGDRTDDYADDSLWYSIDNNQGFTGKLTFKMAPYEVTSVIVGDFKDENGVIAQSLYQGKPVAMAFEFQGDKKATRHILYNVQFSRPGEGSSTKSDKLETGNLEFDFTAGLDPYLEVAKSKSSLDTTQEAFDAWYEKPYRVTKNAFGGSTTPPAG